jgi:hypothetical protein
MTMSYYVFCNKKRNNPRVDVRICEKKCPMKDECKAYNDYNKLMLQDKDLPLNHQSDSPNLEAA